METMKAYVCAKYGPPEVLRLETRPIPKIKPNEVLVKVHATSVTNSDIFIRSSKVDKRLVIPFRLAIGITKPRQGVIGQTFAGVVEQIGAAVTTLKVGDKVYGLTGFSLGAYAEYLKLRTTESMRGCIGPMPENCSFELATAAAYGGLLALQSAEKIATSAGDKVLIYGAASTSGTFALQYYRHLGAEVTAVCSEGKFDFVKTLGAAKTLDYRNDQSIKQLESYDVIIDCVGKARQSPLRQACQNHLKNQANFLSIDDENLVLSAARLGRIKDLVESGAVKPINDRVYGFTQMAEAHAYVEGGHKTGNVAITVV